MSPRKVVGGCESVFATEAPLSTEYVAAVPRFTGVSGSSADDGVETRPTKSNELTSETVPKAASLSDMRGRTDRRMTGDSDWLAASKDMTLP
jgi:hypothetical protein